MSKGKANFEGMKFEEALQRLEKIVEDMESGKLGLDEMVGRFEEGMRLVDFCEKKLNEVEQKIEILKREGNQERTEPFSPEKEEPDLPF